MGGWLEEGAAIAASPHDPDVMFTVGHIYLSSVYWSEAAFTTDGGATWHTDTLEPQRRAYAVAFDVADPNRVYLGGESLYNSPAFKVSTDLGQTWAESHTGLAGGVNSIATVARDASTVYCGTLQGVYKSTDAGATWARQGAMNAVRAVAVDTVSTDVVYAGTASGVYASTDAGTSWVPFNDGLASTDIISLSLRSGHGGLLLAGTNGRGLFSAHPLVGVAEQQTGPDMNRPATRLYSLQPSPFGRRVVIGYSLSAPGRASVQVCDVAGRLVRTLVDSPHKPGRYSVTWNGRDHSGRSLADGVYFCRLVAGGYRATEKLVLQR